MIRESGGDRSAVTGGTKVLSDRIKIRITSNPGETFLDRMIALVEGAERQKTPNEIALNILIAGLTLTRRPCRSSCPTARLASSTTLSGAFFQRNPRNCITGPTGCSINGIADVVMESTAQCWNRSGRTRSGSRSARSRKAPTDAGSTVYLVQAQLNRAGGTRTIFARAETHKKRKWNPGLALKNRSLLHSD